MTFHLSRIRKTIAVVFLLCLVLIVTVCLRENQEKKQSMEVELARQILPGYSFVFAGQTNVIERCRNGRDFSRQHEMMEYLQIFAPYMEGFNHPTNHPILIYETSDRMILELPSRFRFPPYNWEIYWGSGYNLKIEIDKSTKKVVDAVQG